MKTFEIGDVVRYHGPADGRFSRGRNYTVGAYPGRGDIYLVEADTWARSEYFKLASDEED